MPIDDKKMHSSLHKITHLNLVLAIIALIGVLGVYIWVRATATDEEPIIDPQTEQMRDDSTGATNSTSTTLEAADKVDEDVLEDEYKESINSILDQYNFDDAATATELSGQALALRAPASLKDMHLKVVLALDQASQGEFSAAQATIAELEDQYSWFHE